MQVSKMRVIWHHNLSAFTEFEHVVDMPSGSEEPQLVMLSERNIPYHVRIVRKVSDPYSRTQSTELWDKSFQKFYEHSYEGSLYYGDLTGRHHADSHQIPLRVLLSFNNDTSPESVICSVFLVAGISILPNFKARANANLIEGKTFSNPVGLGEHVIALEGVNLEEFDGNIAAYNAYTKEISRPGALQMRATGFISKDNGISIMFPLP